MSPEFKTYQEQVLKNAKVLAEELNNRGYHLVSGETELLVEPHHEKTCLCHMRTTKTQISLRICSPISAFVAKVVQC